MTAALSSGSKSDIQKSAERALLTEYLSAARVEKTCTCVQYEENRTGSGTSFHLRISSYTTPQPAPASGHCLPPPSRVVP